MDRLEDLSSTRVASTGRQTGTVSGPVAEGPRWYRERIRRYGPVCGLIPMALLGAIAAVALWASDSLISAGVGLLFGCAAAPVLLLFGAPFGDSALYPMAVLLSMPIWLGLGWLAARRTIRRPLPTWADFTRELCWMALGVTMGTGLALGLASLWLGGGLIE